MIERRIRTAVEAALSRQAVVALIGPRQVGKTTLARAIGDARGALYLDLEAPSDRAKLADPELFLLGNAERLVILDEIHRAPGLFQVLRGLVDRYRREGNGTGRFLVLGSAAIDLLRQSGESLAGRIAYVDMAPFDAIEVTRGRAPKDPAGLASIERLWLRGGFPDSFLAPDDRVSLKIRLDFIRTYLERDVPQFGRRVPAQTLERFWTMLAHGQGGLLNASRLAAGLSVSAPTVSDYVDLLADLLLVRRLPPYHANIGKRLVKAPKVYVRDSGLTHALLGLADAVALAGHPVVGPSWEGFVIETLVGAAPERTRASFYRTAAGAEMDLVLELPGRPRPWAVEVKRTLAPSLGKGLHAARADIAPERVFVVHAGWERYPLAEGVEAVGVLELARDLADLSA